MMDLVQNSIEADATEIKLTLRETTHQIEFSVRDNGKGMSKETQRKAVDPFYTDGEKHVHRRVGLGLSFLFQTAEATEGHATIESTEGHGTRIHFSANAMQVDLPPLGDLTGAAVMMMSQMPKGELKIIHETEDGSYTLSRKEFEETLGDLHETHNLTLMRTYIHSQENDLRKAG